MEIEIEVPDHLAGADLLAEVQRSHTDQIAVLAELVGGMAPAR